MRCVVLAFALLLGGLVLANPQLDAARAFITDNPPDSCDALGADLPDGGSYLAWPLSAANPDAGLLVMFPCRLGIYNVITVSVLVDAEGNASAALFPTPELNIAYENDDSMGPLKSVDLAGISMSLETVNAGYDPETGTLEAHDKWRGLGDASTYSQWQYRDGHFDLIYFAADPTYDGELNPLILIGRPTD